MSFLAFHTLAGAAKRRQELNIFIQTCALMLTTRNAEIARRKEKEKKNGARAFCQSKSKDC